jgi:hypothetical protein
MNKKSTADRGTAWALRFMLFHAAVKLGRPSHFSPLITQAFLACQDEFQKIILLYQDGALL